MYSHIRTYLLPGPELMLLFYTDYSLRFGRSYNPWEPLEPTVKLRLVVCSFYTFPTALWKYNLDTEEIFLHR